VQQIGEILPDPPGQVEAKPDEGIGSHLPRSNPLRDGQARFHARHVRQDFAVLFLAGECVQKASNVNLVAREVPADGMGINGD
jgi:hypothetical protein